MVDKEVKLSSKYQVVIPKEARDYFHLKAGDKMILTVSTGGHLLLWKKPKNFTKYMKGLGRDVWKGTNVAQYIKKLRQEWR